MMYINMTQQSESTNEPESESTYEPESESTYEPESESANEPEAEEPENGVLNEPENEITNEPEVAYVAEEEVVAENKAIAEPYGSPSASEITLPPFTLLVAIAAALLILSFLTQTKWWKHYLRLNRRNRVKVSLPKLITPRILLKGLDDSTSYNRNEKEQDLPGTDSLFDEEDFIFLEKFYMWQNNPVSVIFIAAPALISLALCPGTLFMYEPLMFFYWPASMFNTPPSINDVIQCFLAPAGLVYAIAFGFAFQEAVAKQKQFADHMTDILTLMRQIVMLATRISSIPNDQKALLLWYLKTCLFDWLAFIAFRRNPDPSQTSKAGLWNAVDIILECDSGTNLVKSFKPTSNLEKKLMSDLIDSTIMLDILTTNYNGQWHSRIHIIQWIFLEFLAFFSFFGILLVKAYSYRLELTLCVLTVFSISLFCYVLADYDSPYHGFFRVDLSIFPSSVLGLDAFYRELCSASETSFIR